MMTIREATRVTRDQDTKVISSSRTAFLWNDVFSVEDETGNEFNWPVEMTWIRTPLDCFYIEGRFEDVLAEWSFFLKKPDNTLVFSRQ